MIKQREESLESLGLVQPEGQRQFGVEESLRSSGLAKIIGRCPAMERVFESIRRIGPTNLDVLLIGETGTGKELVAHAIHDESPRRNQPFESVNCAAIPAELAENELFGHERGAFTGAQQRLHGCLERADGGTLFLDEINRTSLPIQGKLLRVLQERRVRRLGGEEEIQLDVRIISAASVDLEAEVSCGRFRDDLYFRINVALISLPPLRERRDDIPLLSEHFCALYAEQMGRGGVRIGPQVMEVLLDYHWPGNVRELQHAIVKILLSSCEAEASLTDLPEKLAAFGAERQHPGGAGYAADRAAHEREYLCGLLKAHRGNIAKSARDARVARVTLYRRLEKCGLRATDFRSEA